MAFSVRFGRVLKGRSAFMNGQDDLSNVGLSFFAPLNDLGAGVVNLTPSRGIGSPTFTRASTATTILSNGLIGTVASGTARSCYSPAGVYLGYLAEEARTNLCLQSAALDNASWTKTASTISADATASPDGTTTADKIAEDNTTATHLAQQSFTKAASALTYALSVYCKQAERTWVAVQAFDASSNGAQVWVNLATGTLGTTSSFGTTPFTGFSSSVQPAANGFYRVVLIFTTTTATTLITRIAASTGDTVTNYAGTTGSGIYAWGAQLEQAAFATSYIPTTTATVTRNADVLTYPTSGNADPATGAFYCEHTPIGSITSVEGMWALNDGSSNNRIDLRDSNGTLNGIETSGGVGQANINLASVFTLGVTAKVAQVWSTARANVFGNGVAGTATTIATPPASPTLIKISCLDASANQPNGAIRNVRIWNRALADLEMIQLTR